jgi:hypothetical protein
MAQNLADAAYETAAEETPEPLAEFLAWQQNAQNRQNAVSATRLDGNNETEQDIRLSIDQALERLGRDNLTEPIPPRLLELILKGSLPESEM